MRIVRTIRIFAVLLMLAAIAPANAAETMRIPYCANGEILYVWMSFESEEEEDDGRHDSAACHGPCLFERKKLSLKSQPLSPV